MEEEGNKGVEEKGVKGESKQKYLNLECRMTHFEPQRSFTSTFNIHSSAFCGSKLILLNSSGLGLIE
jgi:hypothetical protein